MDNLGHRSGSCLQGTATLRDVVMSPSEKEEACLYHKGDDFLMLSVLPFWCKYPSRLLGIAFVGLGGPGVLTQTNVKFWLLLLQWVIKSCVSNPGVSLSLIFFSFLPESMSQWTPELRVFDSISCCSPSSVQHSAFWFRFKYDSDD